MPRGKLSFKETDLTRPLRAVERAGLNAYGVRLKDGEINVILHEGAPLACRIGAKSGSPRKSASLSECERRYCHHGNIFCSWARAVRRCGELLKQFDGRGDHMKKDADGLSQTATQREFAERAGLSEGQQKQAVRVANVPQETFAREVESAKPRSS